MNVRLPALCRYGFYISILLFFYGNLFPFHFDLSPKALNHDWVNARLVPYWDVHRGRIHSLPDMVSNALLTIPLGFFGALWFGRNRIRPQVARWLAIGLFLGLISETIQLAIPYRTSDITDVFNNGFGALAGAAAAALFGRRILDFVSGSLMEKRLTYFWILAAIVATGMLLPLDFSLDVSHFRSCVKSLMVNPWEAGVPIQNEWIPMAEFAMLGALAGAIRRKRLIAFALLLPIMLEAAQFLVDSHAPSLRDLTMSFAGVTLGMASAWIAPTLVRPATGFVLMNVALVAQGLSPYQFAGQSRFGWIPLAEYYYRTTGAALYDAMAGLLSYALLAALWPRKTTILWAVALAGAIEAVQVFVPTRVAGVTDILIAGIGAWAGYVVSKNGHELHELNEIRNPRKSY
jgi:glycopeptide antibiotics resistance protein